MIFMCFHHESFHSCRNILKNPMVNKLDKVPGRGALEIDILEVLPGSYGPNYKKDKAPWGGWGWG